MLAASRSETIREAQKVFLVNRIEDGDHGLLDDLVLQRRDPQRTLPPVGFRDIHPSRRLGSIRPAVDPAVQIDKSILQPGLILLPRRAVHPRCRFPLQCVKALPEQIDREVVKQGGELHLLVFLRGFPHTRQPLGHACPALCRVRARLTSVLLVQRPSLPILRRRPSVLVRMIHRYYATVRLLGDVHTGRTAVSLRPSAWSTCPTGVPEVSRFSCRKCLGVSGVYDYAGLPRDSR